MNTSQSVDEVLRLHRAIREPRVVKWCGRPFCECPGVFSPFIAPSGVVEIAFATLPFFQGKRVLDVGSGSGLSSCLFALSGASSVTGVDINPLAIEAGQKNAIYAGVDDRVSFCLSDVFGAVSVEKFDVLFANLPFMTRSPRDMLERAFFDPHLSSLRRFIQGAGAAIERSAEVSAYYCAANLESVDLSTTADEAGLIARDIVVVRMPWIELKVVELVAQGRL